MYELKHANWWVHLLVGLSVCLAMLAASSQRQQTDAATVNNGDGDGEGLGGTGIEGGEGIGGTGVIGVISDVDNFTVNGLRIEVDERTSVEIDGKIGSQSDLRRGQVVLIEAEGPPSSLRAEIIFVRHEIVAPITKVASTDDHIFVLDQRVNIPRTLERLTDPKVGDWVAVSGFRISSGQIHSTRIERRDPQRTVQLYGRYDLNKDDRVEPVRVANMKVSGLPPERALVNREVFLRGRFKAGRLSASRIKPQSGLPFENRPERLSVTAYIGDQESEIKQFGLSLAGAAGDIPVIVDDKGKMGRFVAIEGRLEATAERLEIQRIRKVDSPFRQTPGRNDEKESKRTEKQAEKVRKETEKQTEKEKKEAEKRAKGLEKQAEKVRKEAEKQTEKEKKEAEKKAKEREKQAEKERKEREKAAEKERKEAEKQAKEREKQAEKERKEREKKEKKAKKGKKGKKKK